MGQGVFNISKGLEAYYASLPAASDAMILALYTGTETDNNIKDCATMAAVEATALAEVTEGWYSRHTLSSVSVSTDNTNDRKIIANAENIAYTTTAGTAAVKRGVIFYDPNTGTSTDTTRIPVWYGDVVFTADGTVVTITSANLILATD